MNYREEHKAILDEILLAIPGIKVGKAFGYPAYRVNGRIFVFVGRDGIALKLPEARVKTIIDTDPAAKPFEVSEGVFWREWVAINPPSPGRYHHYQALFEESIHYVVD